MTVLEFLLLFVICQCSLAQSDNINGFFQVSQGHHYSNKTSLTWGENGEKSFSVKITMSPEFATYDCSNTTTYSCEDPVWYYDWNKLWGKARCGYMHDHHEDSDRFVWRRCADSTCASYDGTPKIQLGAYSYDGGMVPYENEGTLLKEFKTTLSADTAYVFTLLMDETGLSSFILSSGVDGSEIETKTIQHNTLCVDNFYEGTVQGLYFGGTCTAPVTVVAHYES